jgi:hypothetical protein
MSSIELEPEHLPEPAPANHGMTTAAWALNSGVVVGFIIAGVAMMLRNSPGLWIGVAVVIISLIVGAVLRALGHGQPLR